MRAVYRRGAQQSALLLLLYTLYAVLSQSLRERALRNADIFGVKRRDSDNLQPYCCVLYR